MKFNRKLAAKFVAAMAAIFVFLPVADAGANPVKGAQNDVLDVIDEGTSWA